jgi:hypothetical protein
MTTSVYHLVDPITHTVHYVGKSTSPAARLKEHIRESVERQNTEKKRWIKSLIDQGLKPVMVIVGRYPTDIHARARESAECHRHIGTIFNIHDPLKGASDLAREESAAA